MHSSSSALWLWCPQIAVTRHPNTCSAQPLQGQSLRFSIIIVTHQFHDYDLRLCNLYHHIFHCNQNIAFFSTVRCSKLHPTQIPSNPILTQSIDFKLKFKLIWCNIRLRRHYQRYQAFACLKSYDHVTQ